MALKNAFDQPLFLCIRIGLMCKRCEAEGLVCNHLLSLSPHWKPPEVSYRFSQGRTSFMSARN